jgi:hypothetical protein
MAVGSFASQTHFGSITRTSGVSGELSRRTKETADFRPVPPRD